MITNRSIARIMICIVMTTLLAACTPVDPLAEPEAVDWAVLEGQVTFGPLTPVILKDAPTPEVPPEMFAGREVQIFSLAGETLFASGFVTETGAYRVEIPAGDYLVNFTLVGIERAEGIPAQITLAAGQTIILNIDVDTGIR